MVWSLFSGFSSITKCFFFSEFVLPRSCVSVACQNIKRSVKLAAQQWCLPELLDSQDLFILHCDSSHQNSAYTHLQTYLSPWTFSYFKNNYFNTLNHSGWSLSHKDKSLTHVPKWNTNVKHKIINGIKYSSTSIFNRGNFGSSYSLESAECGSSCIHFTHPDTFVYSHLWLSDIQ